MSALLAAFGVWHPSVDQAKALTDAIVAAGALFVADGIIRHGRSRSLGK